MIKADTSKLEAQLKQYIAEVERKLKYMVVNFGQQVAEYAIGNTPLGDSVTYARYYQARTDLPQVEGIARGNWQFSTNQDGTLQLIAGRQSGDTALDVFSYKASSYQLGQTFYISNAAPYISSLEADSSGQTSGQGILKPTMDTIAATYLIDLKNFYDKG